MNNSQSSSGIKAYAGFFETLDRDSVPDLRKLVTEDVRFRDPFNDVRGVDRMMRIFEDMFEDVENPKFDILATLEDGAHGFIKWRMTASHPSLGDLSFEGVSEVETDRHGRISSHIDYWDPAAAIYDRIPVVGFVLRRISRRLKVE